MPRKRNHRSARQAGSTFERQVADYLAKHVDDRIDRRVRTHKDRGDIAGVRIWGERVAVECKNVARPQLSQWLGEAEIARGNDDAVAGLVVHKRHGKGDPADQLVTLTLADFAALLTGQRPEERE